ncbi:hypothetical protein E2C01_049808 [Portunus trituberculatus]|uniref:Uncharacterized protein n=1 Tax=Portunus trituberculatus TaxID=210409 RepID=A0A5B7GEV1_PORTR|nr:hypothetical protein [Portunus trituberculatus]
MSLLATNDIKEQLHEVTQVILIPNLTLNGIIEVVQREVVKEECPRGILLLCLAGLHGTLVECQVPKECKIAGHSDMQEMVPATKGDSLDPGFPKQLASLKRKLQDTLGRGSSVLFFPVLPVDMTNFNEIAAKHHFDATGHKLEHLSQAGSLHYQLLQQYKKAVEEVNGSSVTYVRLVRFEFSSRGSCRKFTDELLQDGFSPTLDLVERFIVPQLQHAISMSNSLRFQQVALVGDACLAQVVKVQQQKGVEPCSFILQEEPGLRSLIPDSPTVKQLSGMSNALIFLSITLKDLAIPKGESDGKKTHCFLPHDPSKAFDSFLQEALRVDQMLGSLTHHCTIITTPVLILNHQILMKDKARKTSSCEKCTKTSKLVTIAIEQVCKILNQKNGLPVWNLNPALLTNKDDSSSSHQHSKLNSKMLQKAASTWECFLNCSQTCIRVMPKATITSVLQDQKLLTLVIPKTRETSRTHCNKKETQSSHSRHRAQTHCSHNTDKEQTHSRNSRDKKQTHSRSNRNKRVSHSDSGRNKDQIHNSNRNKEQLHNSSSRDKKQTHNKDRKLKDTHSKYEEQKMKSPDALALTALDDITSASSPSRHSNGDLDSISTGNLNFSPSPHPSIINSPEDFVDSFSDESYKDRQINSQTLTCSPDSWKCSSTHEATPLRNPRMRLWSANSRDKPLSPQRFQYTELDEPGHSLYQQRSVTDLCLEAHPFQEGEDPLPEPKDPFPKVEDLFLDVKDPFLGIESQFLGAGDPFLEARDQFLEKGPFPEVVDQIQ